MGGGGDLFYHSSTHLFWKPAYIVEKISVFLNKVDPSIHPSSLGEARGERPNWGTGALIDAILFRAPKKCL